jgi:hypothetical protein
MSPPQAPADASVEPRLWAVRSRTVEWHDVAARADLSSALPGREFLQALRSTPV